VLPIFLQKIISMRLPSRHPDEEFEWTYGAYDDFGWIKIHNNLNEITDCSRRRIDPCHADFTDATAGERSC
jgi:hypothetical protein